MGPAGWRLVGEEEEDQNELENQTKTVLWLETCLELSAS